MLSIQKLGTGNAKYYIELAQEDYYLKGGEPPGQWAGKGAEALRLRGKVEDGSFLALFRGYSPDGSKPLVQNAGQGAGYHRRCPGWDLTFSAPKTVSVLWAMAPESTRTKIQELHQASVRSALEWMEKFAGETRRGKGGMIREQAGLCFALFEHGTSRNQDPQLHTHSILFNLALRLDGTTGSLRSKRLYEFKLAIGALYRAELARLLSQELGLEVERVRNWFEVRGIDKGVAEHFSSRRHELVALCDDRGSYDPIQAEMAALESRQSKDMIPRETLIKAWTAFGELHGWGQREAAQLLDAARHRITVVLSSQETEASLARIMAEVKPGQRLADTLRQIAILAQTEGIEARHLANAASQVSGHEKQTMQANERFQTLPQPATSSRELAIEWTLNPKPNDNHQRQPDRGSVRFDQTSTQDHTASPKPKQDGREFHGSQATGPKLEPRSAHSQSGEATQKAQPRRLPRLRLRPRRLTPQPKPTPRWKKETRFFSLAVQDNYVFPDAPQWNPASKLKLPYLNITPNPDPFGLKAALSEVELPFAMARAAALKRIKEALYRPVGASGTGSPNGPWSFDAVRKLYRKAQGYIRGHLGVETLVATSKSDAWKGLLAAWLRCDSKRRSQTAILTGTQRAADKLNDAIQRARLRKHEVGRKARKIGETLVRLNDRVIFRSGNRHMGIEPGDHGLVTKLTKSRIRFTLDKGGKVEWEISKCPGLALGYAFPSSQALNRPPRAALVLFEANDHVAEANNIAWLHKRTRVRVYTDQQSSVFLTPASMDQARRESEKSQQRSSGSESHPQSKQSQPTETQSNTQSKSQSHSHPASHSHSHSMSHS